MLNREQVEEAARLFLRIYQAEIDTEGWSDEFVTSLLTKFAEEFYTRTDAAKVQRELNDVRADAQQLVRTNQDLRAEVEGAQGCNRRQAEEITERRREVDQERNISFNHEKTIADLTAQLAAMQGERDEAYKLLYGARCIYCGVVVAENCHNQDIGDLQLAAHVDQCEKHPLFKLKQQLTASEARVKELEKALKQRDEQINRIASGGGTWT